MTLFWKHVLWLLPVALFMIGLFLEETDLDWSPYDAFLLDKEPRICDDCKAKGEVK